MRNGVNKKSHILNLYPYIQAATHTPVYPYHTSAFLSRHQFHSGRTHLLSLRHDLLSSLLSAFAFTVACVYLCLQDGGDPSENPRPQQPGGQADWKGGPQLEEDRGGDRDQDSHLPVCLPSSFFNKNTKNTSAPKSMLGSQHLGATLSSIRTHCPPSPPHNLQLTRWRTSAKS